MKNLIFANDNGFDYVVVAGNDERALLRGLHWGGYVIARNLDWTHMQWGGSGSYFAADEFEKAVNAFLSYQRTEGSK
jgi:hypothetical protein